MTDIIIKIERSEYLAMKQIITELETTNKMLKAGNEALRQLKATYSKTERVENKTEKKGANK